MAAAHRRRFHPGGVGVGEHIGDAATGTITIARSTAG
jgi:hypothetical protein